MRCKYAEDVGMPEQSCAKECVYDNWEIEGLRKRVTGAEDTLMALVMLKNSPGEQQERAWRLADDLLRVVRPVEYRLLDGMLNAKK